MYYGTYCQTILYFLICLIKQLLVDTFLNNSINLLFIENCITKDSDISKYENRDRNLDYLEVLSVCIHCNTKPGEFTNHILSNIDINN